MYGIYFSVRMTISFEFYVGFLSPIKNSDVILLQSFGVLAQLARAPVSHTGGHRFESDILHL